MAIVFYSSVRLIVACAGAADRSRSASALLGCKPPGARVSHFIARRDAPHQRDAWAQPRRGLGARTALALRPDSGEIRIATGLGPAPENPRNLLSDFNRPSPYIQEKAVMCQSFRRAGRASAKSVYPAGRGWTRVSWPAQREGSAGTAATIHSTFRAWIDFALALGGLAQGKCILGKTANPCPVGWASVPVRAWSSRRLPQASGAGRAWRPAAASSEVRSRMRLPWRAGEKARTDLRNGLAPV